MKNIVIVTGASSGMGRDFALTVKENVKADELWVIARRLDRLEELKTQIDMKVVPVSLDLSKDESFEEFNKLLVKEKVNIKLLINASGYGKFDNVMNLSIEDNMGMVDLNVRGLTRMCLTCLPYMSKGSGIINFASLAAYQPVPYMNIYAASKAYVLSFTRALNREIRSKGMHAMAVCPYWTKTEFFDRAVTKNTVVKKYSVMYESKKVVNAAWKNYNKGKDVSLYGFVSKGQVALVSLLPKKLVMNIWQKQNDLK